MARLEEVVSEKKKSYDDGYSHALGKIAYDLCESLGLFVNGSVNFDEIVRLKKLLTEPPAYIVTVPDNKPPEALKKLMEGNVTPTITPAISKVELDPPEVEQPNLEELLTMSTPISEPINVDELAKGNTPDEKVKPPHTIEEDDD